MVNSQLIGDIHIMENSHALAESDAIKNRGRSNNGDSHIMENSNLTGRSHNGESHVLGTDNYLTASIYIMEKPAMKK